MSGGLPGSAAARAVATDSRSLEMLVQNVMRTEGPVSVDEMVSKASVDIAGDLDEEHFAKDVPLKTAI